MLKLGYIPGRCNNTDKKLHKLHSLGNHGPAMAHVYVIYRFILFYFTKNMLSLGKFADGDSRDLASVPPVSSFLSTSYSTVLFYHVRDIPPRPV